MLRRSTNELSIRPKLSKSVVIAVSLVSIVALLSALSLAYNIGIRSGHKQYQQDQSLIMQLNDSITDLRKQLDTSEEGLIFAQRQQQIQDEAYKQLSNAYANSEQKNRELGTRLDFYRSIISPENSQSGPAIQALTSKLKDGQVNFDITLVQAIKHKHQVRGNLRVSLYEQDNLRGQWPLSSARSVSYQYFEKISGSIELNEDSLDLNQTKLKVEFKLQSGEILQQWFDLPTV